MPYNPIPSYRLQEIYHLVEESKGERSQKEILEHLGYTKNQAKSIRRYKSLVESGNYTLLGEYHAGKISLDKASAISKSTYNTNKEERKLTTIQQLLNLSKQVEKNKNEIENIKSIFEI